MICVLKYGKQNKSLFCGIRYNSKTCTAEIVDQHINRNAKPLLIESEQSAIEMIKILSGVFPQVKFEIGELSEVDELMEYDSFDLLDLLDELSEQLDEK